MSDAPWTPGPWKADSTDELEEFYMPDGYAMVVSTTYRDSELRDPFLVCPIEKSRMADARLIAAAPEMFELLGDCLDAGSIPEYDIPVEAIAALRARVMGAS